MIELRKDQLIFRFPEVHPKAKLTIEMMRTLRIPDDGKTYPLPPGLGTFPLRHVDDHASSLPESWIRRGGVMMPMYQSEALWLDFHSEYLRDRGASYPFAIKIATGKINAVTGNEWTEGLETLPQDYVVAPRQPWVDGYSVDKGKIRQFVAMPLGDGYTAEEQITGEAEFGGIQLKVFPMKGREFDARFPVRKAVKRFAKKMRSSADPPIDMCLGAAAMGIGAGGEMQQEIYEDEYGLSCWDKDHNSRCFVHLTNSLAWRSITGLEPPQTPFTSKTYNKYGLPWFRHYSDGKAMEGSSVLNKLKSIATLGKQNGKNPLPENESVSVKNIQPTWQKASPYQVREGDL